jgi:predicted Ser/Thr protein kinase
MADGSKVHKKLGWRYQSGYKRICEGEHSAEDIAHSLVQSLIKDVKDYGPLPVRLLRTVSYILETAAEKPLLMRTEDWATFSQWLEQAVRQTYAKQAQEGIRRSRVGIEAAKRACEQQFLDIRRGKVPAQGGILQNLVEGYLTNIHKFNFTEKVPLSSQHYRAADPEIVAERLRNTTSHVMRQVPALAKQMLDEHRDLHTIRTPNRATPRPGVDIDTAIAV